MGRADKGRACALRVVLLPPQEGTEFTTQTPPEDAGFLGWHRSNWKVRFHCNKHRTREARSQSWSDERGEYRDQTPIRGTCPRAQKLNHT